MLNLRKKKCCCGSGSTTPLCSARQPCIVCASTSAWTFANGGANTGKFKLSLSGVTLPTTVTSTLKEIRTSFESLGNPLVVGGNPSHPDSNYLWNLPLSQRQDYRVYGAVPSEIIIDAQNGFCFPNYYSDTRIVNHRGYSSDTIYDAVPGALASYACHGSEFNGSLERRETYKGNWISSNLPYAIPYANGKVPMLVLVSHSLTYEVVQPSFGSSDPAKVRIKGSSTSTCYYHGDDAYPTWTGGNLTRACEGETTRVTTSAIWLLAEADLSTFAPSSSSSSESSSSSSSSSGIVRDYPDVFPCSRSEWELQNVNTVGAIVDGNTSNAANGMGITSGGSLTITPVANEAFGWLHDAVDEYTLNMSIGRPRHYHSEPGVTDYGPPLTTTLEPLSIAMKRYCVSEPSEPDAEWLGLPKAVWYGEDANYMARLESEFFGEATRSTIVVERKLQWPNGASPRVVKFTHYNEFGTYYSPPENSAANPRYTLSGGRPKDASCLVEGAPPIYDGAYADKVGFCFTVPTLTKTGSPFTCPQRPRGNSPCRNQYLVCWKSDGSKATVQQLDAVTSSSSSSSSDSSSSSSSSIYGPTPTDPETDSRCAGDTDRSAIITQIACICEDGGDGYICETRWEKLKGSEYDAETGQTYDVGDYVNLQPAARIEYGYVGPPAWELSIRQECPPRSFNFTTDANSPDAADALCPYLGNYIASENNGRLCSYGTTDCTDCYNCESAVTGFDLWIQLTEYGQTQYVDDGGEFGEWPYAHLQLSYNQNCLWKGGSIDNAFDGTELYAELTMVSIDPRTNLPFINGKPHFWLKVYDAFDINIPKFEAVAYCSIGTPVDALQFETVTNSITDYESYAYTQ